MNVLEKEMIPLCELFQLNWSVCYLWLSNSNWFACVIVNYFTRIWPGNCNAFPQWIYYVTLHRPEEYYVLLKLYAQNRIKKIVKWNVLIYISTGNHFLTALRCLMQAGVGIVGEGRSKIFSYISREGAIDRKESTFFFK